MSNVRHLAVQLLNTVEMHGTFVDDAAAQSLSQHQLSDQDRRLLTQLTHGSLRRKLALDHALNHVSKRPMHDLPALTRDILRIGAYQILFLDSIPQRAAVNEMVNVAHHMSHRGTANYVNAVLRNLIRQLETIPWPDVHKEPLEYIHTAASYPRWLAERWYEQLGPESAVQLAQALNESPKPSARHNSLRITRSELCQQLTADDVFQSSSSWIPDSFIGVSHQKLLQHKGLQQGWYYIQSESSCLPASAGQLRPNLTVIDLCSAPGGKTAHIAERMGNRGQLTAVDQSESRLALLRSNIDRLGVVNVRVIQDDAKRLEICPQDRVFLDAPCSGLGTLNHKPDIRWHKSLGQIQELVALQRELLRNAARLTALGGLLIYSTCTTEYAENEGQIRWLLANFPQFRLEPLPHWFPEHENPGMLQIWPHIHKSDGFFVAVLRRTSSHQ